MTLEQKAKALHKHLHVGLWKGASAALYRRFSAARRGEVIDFTDTTNGISVRVVVDEDRAIAEHAGIVVADHEGSYAVRPSRRGLKRSTRHKSGYAVFMELSPDVWRALKLAGRPGEKVPTTAYRLLKAAVALP